MTDQGGGERRDRSKSYPHLGQPERLTVRDALAWRQSNTYYLVRGEAIRSATLASPPDCFTPDEWEKYCASLPSEAWYLENSPTSPFTRMPEPPESVNARQSRTAPMVACEDCTLPYQLSQVLVNRCHPPRFATTPADRLLAMERMEGETDVARSTPDVLSQEGVSDREVR